MVWHMDAAANLNQTTGEIIAARLGQLNVSKARLGRALDMDRQTITTRIKGTSDWKLPEIVRVCDLLGLDLGEMVAAALSGQVSMNLVDPADDLPIRRFGCTPGLVSTPA